MTKYIAFLRGINVGGHRKIKMADLRTSLEQNNFEAVQTYIQSGNLVFTTQLKNPSKALSNLIKESFGFEVPVFSCTLETLEEILVNCPFPQQKMEDSYFTLLHAAPEKELMVKLQDEHYPDEEFRVTDSCVYFYASKGYRKATCNNNFFEKRLKVAATTRNYRTIKKMLELAQQKR